MKEFHIAYFISRSDKVLSGKNYFAENVLEVLNKFVDDEKTPDISEIKYIYEK